MSELQGVISGLDLVAGYVTIGADTFEVEDRAIRFLEGLQLEDKVVYSLSADGKVRYIRPSDASFDSAGEMPKNSKANYWAEKDRRITRAAALKITISYFQMRGEIADFETVCGAVLGFEKFISEVDKNV